MDWGRHRESGVGKCQTEQEYILSGSIKPENMLNYKSFDLDDVILTPISDNDAEDIFDLFSNNGYCKFFRPKLDDVDESSSYIKEVNMGRAMGTIFNWGIYKKKGGLWGSKKKGKLIGLILFEKSRVNLMLSAASDFCIKIIVNEDYTEKGIAAKSIDHVVNYLTEPGSFKYISGWTSPYNSKTIKLFKKLGFNFLGVNANGVVSFFKTPTHGGSVKMQIVQSSLSSFVPIKFSIHDDNEKYGHLFSEFPMVETENLFLRPFRKTDASRFEELINQDDISPEFDGPVSPQNAQDYVTYSFPKAFIERKYITWAIELKNERKVIGLRDLYVDSPMDPVVTQGFIGKQFRDQGYHQEGLRACISLVRDSGFTDVIANCSQNNQVAKHILEKNGFSKLSEFNPPFSVGRIKYGLVLNS